MNEKKLDGTETLSNLARAFAGECQALVRYELLAEKAQSIKLCEVGKLMRTLAHNENAHAGIWYNLITENGTKKIDSLEVSGGYPFKAGCVPDELRYASDNEEDEYSKIYPAFAKTAKKEGFPEIARKFELVALVERCHHLMLKEIYPKLEQGLLYKSKDPIKFKCGHCGHEAELVEGWAFCPLCGYQQGEIKVPLSE